MYSKNNSCPRTDPCGTTERIISAPERRLSRELEYSHRSTITGKQIVIFVIKCTDIEHMTFTLTGKSSTHCGKILYYYLFMFP